MFDLGFVIFYFPAKSKDVLYQEHLQERVDNPSPRGSTILHYILFAAALQSPFPSALQRASIASSTIFPGIFPLLIYFPRVSNTVFISHLAILVS